MKIVGSQERPRGRSFLDHVAPSCIWPNQYAQSWIASPADEKDNWKSHGPHQQGCGGLCPGELVVEEVVAGHESIDEVVDLEKCIDTGLSHGNDPLSLNFYYGDCNKYHEDSKEFNENEQKPLLDMEENHCDPSGRGMFNVYLSYLDVDDENLQQMAFDSSKMMESENPLSNLELRKCLSVVSSFGDSGTSSSKKNPKASYQLLGDILALFASTSDAPTKDVAFRLNLAM
ncbi:hypothetical protein PVL29_004664 [Vitis rotundifolia]|uniref:Uncharacterized protein n=1 Tax=Vitis rotundifolia TaxID=103349 RepID=A0AA39DZX7_VITRO|nr:hypothetical protein PVL29_004664 [Vitis rotundifolia]